MGKFEASIKFDDWYSFLDWFFYVSSEDEIPELDATKEAVNHEPIDWKLKQNHYLILQQYSNYKKYLRAVYLSRLRKKDPKNLIQKLTEITTDAEEQYTLLYFFCYHKYKDKLLPIKPKNNNRINKKAKLAKELHQKGLSIPELAKMFNVTERTVYNWLKK